MDVKNLLNHPHRFLNGCIKEYGIERHKHHDKRNDRINYFCYSSGCQNYSSIT